MHFFTTSSRPVKINLCGRLEIGHGGGHARNPGEEWHHLFFRLHGRPQRRGEETTGYDTVSPSSVKG